MSYFTDIARYYVASEDSEPGVGWDYNFLSGTRLVFLFHVYSRLIRFSPGIGSLTPQQVGVSIVETFAEQVLHLGLYPLTLGCFDLSKV